MKEIPYSEEAKVKVGDIEIVYDTFGDPSSPPLLLIMGLGSQMILWDDAFCKALASQGFWVIRFDNRDVGLSTKLDDAGTPDAFSLMQGKTVEVPYKLLDMAADALGLLDALKIDSTHVVGASMGGMIAQTMAINYPERVRTLTSIMSSTGNPDLPQPKPEAVSILVTTPPSDRDEYIDYQLQVWRTLHGPKFPPDEEYVRERSARAYDRSYYPHGTGRQFAAILASGSRRDALKKLKTPTLVIHGDADPLVPVEGGRDTAEAISGSELLIIEGMGHGIPVQVAPRIIEAIVRHAASHTER
ncbi:MAG: alpha/beta fold hydrolase [Candidatus Thorarchaeota archaeon SMTZ1-83]|nr:MAG: alpha/beta hydrolase [Candidatus Thorarchaeota archaeon SMTZ1-83]